MVGQGDETMDEVNERPGDRERWEAVEEGVELLQEGETDAALAALTKASEENPHNEYAFFFLGGVYFERRDWARALKCYVRAMEIAPSYVGAMIGAGQALRMLGDHARALRMGRQVLRLRPDDPDALFLLGATHFQRAEYREARPFLERFLRTNPEIEVAMEVEGMLQIVRGEAE